MPVVENETVLSFPVVRKYLSKVSYINQGGCAIAALVMKRWLKKFENIESDIVYGFTEWDAPNYSRNNKAITENNAVYSSSCTHAGLRIKGESIIKDVDEIWGEHKYQYLLTMPEDFVIKSLSKRGCWNSWFDRENVKRIAEHLEIDLSDVPLACNEN